MFIKGPGWDVVFAEAAGFGLADLADVDVPRWGLAEVPGEGVVFVSLAMSHRTAVDVLFRANSVVNPEMLESCVAFDCWIANADRNVSNIVAHATGDGKAQAYAIDFEKARVLRGIDRFTLATEHPKAFLPKEALRELCRGLVFPGRSIDKIGEIDSHEMEHFLRGLGFDVSAPQEFCERVVRHLLARRENLESTLREAWPYV